MAASLTRSIVDPVAQAEWDVDALGDAGPGSCAPRLAA